MWFPSLFAVRRRASARPRPARRPASCRLAVEALEDRDAPGSLAPDAFPNGLGTSVFSDWSNDAIADLSAPKHPTTTIDVTLDNGEGALRPAELPSPRAPQAPDSDGNSDRQPKLVTPGSQSDGGAAALFLASLASHSAPVPISGEISADNGHFEPFAQDGNVVYFHHDDTHELTGDMHGEFVEVGILALDMVTGEGFFTAEGTFTGTVLGESGTATLRVHGEVRDFFVTDRGHFVITQGRDGLDGVHAVGTFEYTVGVGGRYDGLAHFDEQP